MSHSPLTNTAKSAVDAVMVLLHDCLEIYTGPNRPRNGRLDEDYVYAHGPRALEVLKLIRAAIESHQATNSAVFEIVFKASGGNWVLSSPAPLVRLIEWTVNETEYAKLTLAPFGQLLKQTGQEYKLQVSSNLVTFGGNIIWTAPAPRPKATE